MESANQPNSQSIPVAAAVQSELPLSPAALSALGYFFGLIAIAALFLKQYEKEPNVRFHAVQALLFQVSWVITYVIIAVFTAILTAVASVLLGSLKLFALLRLFLLIPSSISLLFSMGMLMVWVALIVSAAQGKKLSLPVLGKMSESLLKH